MLDILFSITVTDIIDIGLVTVFLYTAIAWAKRTRAAFVVRGILTLGVVYLGARQLDLQLTAWIFQGFFAVFLIIIVVIFQEELRQIFERIAFWSIASKSSPPARSGVVDILVRTLADLEKDKIGALIVIRGNDPLERHITGGIPLEGKLSEPLLKSLFDPHSPGHDGAVIIEGGEISRFATHLPLSKDLSQLSQRGTRHGAALGLAELTDALAVVVSEERGKISVARDGRLREIKNLQELLAVIQDFMQAKYPSQERSQLFIQFLRENWFAKLAALSLSISFWYVFVPGSKIVEVSLRIPIKVENLSPEFQLEAVQPAEINATFAGPRRAFYLFNPKELRVTVDASLVELGRRTFQISERNVHYPKELTLQELYPSTLRISVRRLSRGDGEQKGGLMSAP